MPGWQRAYVAGCAGAIAFALAYVGVDYAKLRHLVYEPMTRQWAFQANAPGVAMGYYGMWSVALAAGLLVGLAAHAATRIKRTPIGERALGLTFAWTLTAFVLGVGYYTWNNLP
jgi:hypothetical protein